jgi:hypothetical protein
MKIISERQYKINENINNHAENALAVVVAFGTDAEVALVTEIVENHKIGGLSFEDQKIRDQIADKYWNTIVKHWERVAV